jgi:co-chaperonin GroES (HSP10)
MKFRPPYRIVMRRAEVDRKFKGGIISPDIAEEKPQKAK